MTRSSMLEVIRQDYIRTAKAKGQSEFKIVISHAFRNALVPIITTIGIQICGFLAGSVLVESVFALPGLGKYVVDSVNYKDYPAVQGVVLFIAINCVIINLLTDIIYCFVDPRIKAQYGRKKGVKFRKRRLQAAWLRQLGRKAAPGGLSFTLAQEEQAGHAGTGHFDFGSADGSFCNGSGTL